ALVGDHLASLLAGQPTGDLLGRPAACEPLNDGGSQALITFQARSLPAPCPGLLLGIAGPVPNLPAPVTLQFPRNCLWRAIQSCRDLPDRVVIGRKPGNLASIFQG